MSTPEGGFDAVETVLRDALGDGAMPGVAARVHQHGRLRWAWHGGDAELRPVRRPVQADTAWDLASLTKVLCTTPLALALHAAGRLDLDAPLSERLPWAPVGVTAAHCLQHSSGLRPWVPLFQAVVDDGVAWGTASLREALARRAAAQVQGPPGQAHAYSDLGFLLLGAALEAAGGDRLDRLWEQHVRAPLDVDLRFGWPGAAATEDCPVRGRVVAGEVHDLNAAVMGGIAPHAGLFGAADAVATFADAMVAAWQGTGGSGIDRGLLRRAWTEPGPGSHRLGWDSVSPQGSTAGARWPGDGVGHLGFTGTSLWIAPAAGLVAVLLTNRVHPDIEGGAVPGAEPGPRTRAFRALRPAFHEAVCRAVGL
ncbi:MAG: beta-lactamase family protein [Alphaproteobacteria bacterium]|nr:beta-lactamase family protein [Alphaproteobacteria bacterium]